MDTEAKISEPTKSPMNLLKLPVEILLDIFEHLELRDLVLLARTHPYTRTLVDVLVKQEFSNNAVKITNEFQPATNDFNTFSFQIGKDRAVPLDIESTLLCVRIFGHHLTSLSV